jgi:Uma2 family endonuclease
MVTALKNHHATIEKQPLVLWPRPYRLSVGQYDDMIEAGILTVNDRIELLQGLLVEKMARNPPHDSTVSRIIRRFIPILPAHWLLRAQAAVVLRDSEPEPDIAIVRGEESVFDRRKPTARDVGLLIEVSDSTLLDDRRFKGLLYAQAHILQYWIVNVPDNCIEVYTKPKAGKAPKYGHRRDFHGDELLPLILDGEEITEFLVSDLIPR